MSDADAQLLLKKRARRRLVGAVAFVLFAAVVLPMVMDASPPLPSQEVQIRIPGQEQAIFAPQSVQTAKANADKAEAASEPASPSAAATPATPAPAAVASPAPAVVAATAAVAGAAVVAAKPADKASEKTAEKPVAKPADKVADKAPEKTADKKAADKPADKAKPVDKNDKKPESHKGESDRAASILSGKPAAAAAAAGGSHVILIGAYANPGNVKVLRSKLDQIGVKTYTETLTSPQGSKTRLRAGPFPSKDAADKALEKMKRIGVSGVVSAK